MRKVVVLFSVLMVVALLAGCAPAATPAASQPAATTAPAAAPAAATTAKPYIPVISKGFQHQFWQAVKLGSENAAKEFNVDITFEGPGSEAEVDKQIEMLQTALRQEPGRHLLRSGRLEGSDPALGKGQGRQHPGGRL